MNDPTLCDIDGCDTRPFAHVIVQFFAGKFTFLLCEYHLNEAEKMKPVVVEGHDAGPNCEMPGSDWYNLQGGHESTCICADGDAEVTLDGDDDQQR